MTKQFFIIASLSVAVFLTSCDQQPKQGNSKESKTETTDSLNVTKTTEATDNDIVKQSLTDKDGNQLDMVFDNAKDIVVITFKGENAELISQKPASGIWYKNDHYELSGKGNDIQLKKDGELVFDHQDDKVELEAENDKGDVLNMTFNNTEGTVKAYLNGGTQIDLKEQRAASGIWYKNDHYELSGKGDHYELKKDGETIFKN